MMDEEVPKEKLKTEEETRGDKDSSDTQGDDPSPELTEEKLEELDSEQLAELYHKSFKSFSEGEIIEGIVIKVSSNWILVDIGYKSDALVPLQEFRDSEGNITVKSGDKVNLLFEYVENMEGYLVLSKEKAEKMKVWDQIEKAYNENSVVTGRVIERIKGGLTVDIGVKAFLPGSQVDVRPVRNLDTLRGKELEMKVIKLNKRRGNIVLSRKVVIEEENRRKREQLLASLTEGEIVKGIVKNITEYGAFIDLGGIDGLLHITDMSWGRVNHPSELFVIGDEVEVVVLKFDRDSNRVSLGYKQKAPDPWLKAEEKYPVGSRVRGKVVSLTDYGAFIELEEGIEGLIHISEMSWNKRIKHPSRIVSIGDTVEAVVLHIDQSLRRISLGLKQTEPNPWKMIEEKYSIGSVIKGRLRNLTDFGAFVEVEEGIDGLIHISDMSWTKRIKHPSEMLKKGDIVEAVILNIDAESQRLSLGLKQMTPNVWEEFFKKHRMGDVVKGKIVSITNFGAFVELTPGVEGLVHISELDKERLTDPKQKYKAGETLTLKIVKLDPQERKIGLSLTAYLADKEKLDIEKFAPERGGVIIGDVIDKKTLGQLEKSKRKHKKSASPSTEK